jgi:hypothetical protein
MASEERPHFIFVRRGDWRLGAGNELCDAVVFATGSPSGLTPYEFFGPGFWIGFTLRLIAAEAWVRRTRPQTLVLPAGSAHFCSAPQARASARRCSRSAAVSRSSPEATEQNGRVAANKTDQQTERCGT